MLEAAANAAANAVGMEGLGAFGEMANEYKIYADDGGSGASILGGWRVVFVFISPHPNVLCAIPPRQPEVQCD